MREKVRSVWIFIKNATKFLTFPVLAFSSATIAGGIFWIALSNQNRPKELALIAVLAITIVAVLIAAFAVALVHKVINRGATDLENGIVFRESIRRFAWLTAPIAASYGLTQVATEIANIVAD